MPTLGTLEIPAYHAVVVFAGSDRDAELEVKEPKVENMMPSHAMVCQHYHGSDPSTHHSG